MSGFSVGSFSFSRSGHRRGGFARRSHSSGHGIGGFLRGSHSSGHRGRYVQGGHMRPVRRAGCMGVFVIGAALAGGAWFGLASLLG